MLKLNWFNSKKHTQTRFIEINKTYFKVQNHWFWNEYDKTGWEPQTYNILKQFVSPDAVYIDVGTWVGMTIFFAAELGYKQIYGIEANPESFAIVKQNCAYNKSTLSADLSNLCVTNIDGGMVDFGGKIKNGTSSASSIRGHDWKISSTKLSSFIKNKNLFGKKLIIKIDIEGAEELILDDLKNLSDYTVFLALHPPLFKDLKNTAEKIVSVSNKWKNIRDAKMNPLNNEKLFAMLTSDIKNPSWGTKFGNFFEILLTNENI